jgi:aminopeptidase N
MQPFKSFRLFMSILFSLLGVLGCSSLTRLAAPTQTAVPPTAASIQSTATQPAATQADEADVGTAGMGDSLYPTFGNGGYDVQHYTLDLTVHDVATSELEGITTIESHATQDLSSFNLDFIGFDITSITIDSQPADFERRGQELTINPPTPISKDQPFTTEIRYQGLPGETQSIALPFATGWVTFEGGSYVLGEPDGPASYYPVNDHPLDKASYTFRVTVPDPFEVAANGILAETTNHGETTTFLFEARDPMASYLATVNIGEFDIETSQSENGIPIRNYYPARLPENKREPFQRQGDMIAYFSELFGPYPFEVYGAVVIDTGFGAALETQTLSIFSIAMLESGPVEGAEQVVAHELAHQWFGDSVSLADWSDIWLNEGFATYAQALWTEHTQGKAVTEEWARQMYQFFLENPDENLPPGEPRANNLFNGSVYYRGALTLHALRLDVGDDVFFDILKTYQERYRGGNARTADFIAVAEEVSGRDLDTFFRDWLYRRGLPPIPALGLEVK